MTTLSAAVKDSGAFDVTLEGGREQLYDPALDLQDDNHPVAKISNKNTTMEHKQNSLHF